MDHDLITRNIEKAKRSVRGSKVGGQVRLRSKWFWVGRINVYTLWLGIMGVFAMMM